MPSQAWQHGPKTPLFTSCLQVRSLKTRRASPHSLGTSSSNLAHGRSSSRPCQRALAPAGPPKNEPYQGKTLTVSAAAKRSSTPQCSQRVTEGQGQHTPPQSDTPESLLPTRLRPARRAVARKAQPHSQFEHLASANAAERMHQCLTSGEAPCQGQHGCSAQYSPPASRPAPRTLTARLQCPIFFPCLTFQLLHAALSPRHARARPSLAAGWWGEEGARMCSQGPGLSRLQGSRR